MKFGQSIEYNMWNIFLEKSYTKYGRETIPRIIPKKLKLAISLDPYSKVLYSWRFGHVEKQLMCKGKVNFKIYDVKTWLTSNCKTQEVNVVKQLNLVSQ